MELWTQVWMSQDCEGGDDEMYEQFGMKTWRVKRDTYGRLDSTVSKSNFENCERACELARVVSQFSIFRKWVRWQ